MFAPTNNAGGNIVAAQEEMPPRGQGEVVQKIPNTTQMGMKPELFLDPQGTSVRAEHAGTRLWR